jgi:hypothetical protein
LAGESDVDKHPAMKTRLRSVTVSGKSLFLASCAASALSATVRAEESTRGEATVVAPPPSRHEITASTNGGLYFDSKVLDEKFLSAWVSGGYHYSLLPWLQLGGQTSLSLVHSPAHTEVGTSLLLGPTFNFPFESDLRDAFYLRVLGGTKRANVAVYEGNTMSTDSKYRAAMEVSIGKRFQITESLSYNPHVTATRVFVKGERTAFAVVPLSFSLHL